MGAQPYFEQDGIELHHGDARDLSMLADESVQTCVTSPPYWGLRDYGVTGQIGLEQSPSAYVETMVAVFREVRRVLRADGTLWLNLGDSYNNAGSSRNGEGLDGVRRGGATGPDGECGYKKKDFRHALKNYGIKIKDLVGIPWAVAFALRADGWYLRQDIIWHKPNPMPESVTDRCTKAHEYIFLLSKSERYYYNAEAIKEQMALDSPARYKYEFSPTDGDEVNDRRTVPSGLRAPIRQDGTFVRNCRSVWTITTNPYPGAHFATFPPTIPERCILAGSKPGDLVLDPFNGSGTTGAVCQKWGRRYVGVDLNAEYIEMSKQRFSQRVLFGASRPLPAARSENRGGA